VDGDIWFELESLPRLPSGKPVKGGGALAFGSGLVWALKGNKTFEFFSYDRGADDDALPRPGPAQAQASALGSGIWVASIRPNPMRAGFATLALSGLAGPWSSAPVRVEVFDATGRCVLQTSRSARAGLLHLDLRAARAGVYLVRLAAGNSSVTRKLVIER
jgi:hypothetical protein